MLSGEEEEQEGEEAEEEAEEEEEEGDERGGSIASLYETLRAITLRGEEEAWEQGVGGLIQQRIPPRNLLFYVKVLLDSFCQ
jgi:hypothetical protein